jgi:acyl-CoA reductase-like NAD-dependent aldehyde dehydrogenase
MLRLNGEITLSTHPATESAARGNPEPAAPANGPAPRVQQPAGELQRRPISSSPTTGRALAFADGLDSELHQRAEAAIETFRSCFDAALAEGSPHERARLRQAASDLMRVAARTTIVLDRLNALSERAAVRFDPRSNRSWPS